MRYTSQWIRLALLGVLVLGSVSAKAQAPQPAAQVSAPTAPIPRVTLSAWRSFVLNTGFDITRVAITNPNIADATVVSPQEILLDGKSTGTVSLIVWGENQRAQYKVVVDPRRVDVAAPAGSAARRRHPFERDARSGLPYGPRDRPERHAARR